MFKAELDLNALAVPRSETPYRYAVDHGYIQAFPHSNIEVIAAASEERWFLAVREKMSDTDIPPRSVSTLDNAAYETQFAEALAWPLDSILIEVAQQGGRLKLHAGALCIAPVYYLLRNNQLRISWNMADLIDGSSAFDLQQLSRSLSLQTIYAANQICFGVTLLTERSVAYFEPGCAQHRYPASHEASYETIDCSGEEALELFQDTLNSIIAARPHLAVHSATELSGGMDSASVAAALTCLAGPVRSYGILFHGEVGSTQSARRRQIVEALALDDHTIRMDDFPPAISLNGRHARLERPIGEYYPEAFEQLWDDAEKCGKTLLFTGLGGDELFLPTLDRAITFDPRNLIGRAKQQALVMMTPMARDAASIAPAFDAPASVTPLSGLQASLSQAPYLLKRGIWPINPLNDPRLLELCRRLPTQLTDGRALLKAHLNLTFGPNVFAKRYRKETFEQVLPPLLAKHENLLINELKDCALADLKLVSTTEAVALLKHAATSQDFSATAAFATFMWLERYVRRLA